mmetsp:Transcript_1802/g.4045  ORF Transcript_1802/g.4045 Transcript_1802/m.4045 type:complete len:201 (-) Transcript_1802:880-1482(-)
MSCFLPASMKSLKSWYPASGRNSGTMCPDRRTVTKLKSVSTSGISYLVMYPAGVALLLVYHGVHGLFSFSTPWLSRSPIHSSFPMYGTQLSASPLKIRMRSFLTSSGYKVTDAGPEVEYEKPEAPGVALARFKAFRTSSRTNHSLMPLMDLQWYGYPPFILVRVSWVPAGSARPSRRVDSSQVMSLPVRSRKSLVAGQLS